MPKGKDPRKEPDTAKSPDPATDPAASADRMPSDPDAPTEATSAAEADPSPGPASSDGTPLPGAAPRRSVQRFVVSQLLSGYLTPELRRDARDMFNNRLARVLLPDVAVIADTDAAPAPDNLRRVVVIEADPKELRAKAAEMTADTIIEPELPRVPAIAYPAELVAAAASQDPGGPGTGAMLALLLQDPESGAVPSTRVIVRFDALQDAGATTLAGGRSDAQGKVSVAFDPNRWRPTLAVVEPSARYWSSYVRMPQSGQTIRLGTLPRSGPFGWWQYLTGMPFYDPEAGRGIKIGIVDTGVGPHPYLDHVVPVGAFVDGAFLAGAAEGRDVQNHGTHVSGIIGARPASSDSGDYAGVAAGAEIHMARVFTPTGGGNQGDIARAVEMLSGHQKVDIINMSLAGAASLIEQDSIILAYRAGTVCVCAAGNRNGADVGYPAAYPEAIAVSALGLFGRSPAAALAALNAPTQAEAYGLGGLFLARFSNVGPQLFCAAGGNGIVSTVPATASDAAPYADMSGTSMASPLVAGILANLVANDQAFAALPRSEARSTYAKALLARHAAQIGLKPTFAGSGLARSV